MLEDNFLRGIASVSVGYDVTATSVITSVTTSVSVDDIVYNEAVWLNWLHAAWVRLNGKLLEELFSRLECDCPSDVHWLSVGEQGVTTLADGTLEVSLTLLLIEGNDLIVRIFHLLVFLLELLVDTLVQWEVLYDICD